jgi:GNAT superfamily N-acetyltransferase
MSALISVRLAEPNETPIVYALMRAGFSETAALANASSALNETLGEGGAILAFHDARPAGSGRFRVNRAAGYLIYERLAVHPLLRGLGIGSAMVAFLENHARALGLSEVRADARSQQPDNRAYYLARGYQILGYAERYGIPDLRTHLGKTL